MDGRTRLARIAAVLRQVDADFIALQEVFGLQAETLARDCGYQLAFAPARLHRGVSYGNASLSRHGFDHIQPIDITTPQREPRLALRTDVAWGTQRLHIFNLHLGTAHRERRLQAERLIADDLLHATDLAGPRIVLGDFNEWTDGLASRTLRGEFPSSLPRRRSFPALLPFLSLDHIYCDRHLSLDLLHHHRTRLALIASDHLPLVAELGIA